MQFASRAWTVRAEEEHHSAAVFAESLSHLVDADVPLDVLGHLSRIVGDEIEHAILCGDMARRMRTAIPCSRPLARPRIAAGVAARRAHGLGILLVSGAIGESISNALFHAGYRDTEERCAKAALKRIVRDEVLHARAFWEALDALRGSLTAAEHEALHPMARRALGPLEQRIALPALQRLERADAFEPAWAALGVLAPEARVEAFYRAIEGVSCRKLEELALDGQLARHARYP